MFPSRFSVGSILFTLALLAGPVGAETFDAEIPHHWKDNFDKAAFILWLPEHAAPVRGVAVVLDGINVDGRHLAGRAQWQEFARSHALALVACYFHSGNLSHPTYCQAELGSGNALLAGLAALGKTSSHPELATVPVVIMGFSAGGQFSYSFACFCPTRVVAFTSNKGGIYLTPATPAVREIPGLFIAGAKDLVQRRSAIGAIYSENRRLGARWCMAVEPNRGHETAYANDLALPFFDAVLRHRGETAATRAGIVFDLDRHQLIPPGVPPAESSATFWFPDESTLAVWTKFLTTPR